MVIIRKKSDSYQQLTDELKQLYQLLQDEKNEEDACEEIQKILTEMSTKPSAAIIERVSELFHGDFELSAYTLRGESVREWSRADQLYLVCSKILNLVAQLS